MRASFMIAGVYIAVAMIISVPMTLFALACGGGFLLHEVIDKLRGELTMVIIAHRSSTIRRADLIVVLDWGVQKVTNLSPVFWI